MLYCLSHQGSPEKRGTPPKYKTAPVIFSWKCETSIKIAKDWKMQNSTINAKNSKDHDPFFFPFIFISWRLITLEYCSGFVIHWHESAMDLHVFPIPIPPPTSLSTRSLWVFPVHQARALVSYIQPGLVIWTLWDHDPFLSSPISGYNARGRDLFWTVKIFHLSLTIPKTWDSL